MSVQQQLKEIPSLDSEGALIVVGNGHYYQTKIIFLFCVQLALMSIFIKVFLP